MPKSPQGELVGPHSGAPPAGWQGFITVLLLPLAVQTHSRNDLATVSWGGSASDDGDDMVVELVLGDKLDMSSEAVETRELSVPWR